jgi:amino acid adenylation domain-containing protein/non-ribosomal peptide synthase protein (TIGR01720 family)
MPMLTGAEREQILVEWNETDAVFPQDQTVSELIEARESESPEATAVVVGDTELSYAELNARANRLASYLRELGVGPDILVGIHAERSLEMVIGLLATLKAGGAFLPLDPDYPRQRLEFMLRDARPAVVVTQGRLADQLPSTSAPVVCLDTSGTAGGSRPGGNIKQSASARNLAYIIYTSGSTGVPKGVMIEHRSIVNRLSWGQRQVRLSSDDAVLQRTQFSFDVSVNEIFWPLSAGAKLVLCAPRKHGDPEYVADMIDRHSVTVLQVVPTMLHAFLLGVSTSCRSLRHVFSGGEALSAHDRDEFMRSFPNCQLYNLYGPTETSIDASCFICTTSQDPTVPIGRPIANTRLYVLDPAGYPTPMGQAGELHIAGKALARGYMSRPGLTAERFVPCPFLPGERMYKTGDLVRYLSDGNIEFLGRIDNQVKIRGYRVEPEEVEAALLAHPLVDQAAVVAREDVHGGHRLIGYVVSQAGVPSADILREYLRKTLPAYMIPAIFVPMETLPLTGSGKLDRKALPTPDDRRPILLGEFVAPQTQREAALVEIWSDVLGINQVGVRDNFFELGGDSIIALLVVSRAAQRGLGISTRQIFEHQSIAALAQTAHEDSAIVAEQGRVEGTVPLLPIQRWFFAQDFPDPHQWNTEAVFWVQAVPDRARRALAALVAHHDALRLRYRPTDATWEQRNAAVETHDVFTYHDLSTVPAAEVPAAMDRVAAQLHRSLNLSDGPLLRAAQFGLPAGQDRLLVVFHHLVMDGVSLRIFQEDLATALAQLDRGEMIRLPAKTSSFKEWAERLTRYADSDELASELPYWGQLATVGTGALPVDLPGGDDDYSTAGSVTVSLSPEETRRLLSAVPRVYGTQINDVLLTALSRVIVGFCGRPMLVELEGHGREDIFPDVDVSRTIGWFTSAFPVLLGMESGTPGERLKQVKEQLRGIPSRGVGYGILLHLSSPGTRKQLEAIQEPVITFNYLGQFNRLGLADSDVQIRTVASSGIRPRPLEINGSVHQEKLSFEFSYSTTRYRQETVLRLADAFIDELRALISYCLEPGRIGYTPSDFPLAGLNQEAIDDRLTVPGILDAYPLSPEQLGMLFYSVYGPDSSAYVVQRLERFTGDLDTKVLEDAWKALVERNDVLRTSFSWQGRGQPLQLVHDHADLPFAVADVRGLDEAEQRSAVGAYLAEDRSRGFDLSHAPLMRIRVFKISDREHRMVVTLHHVILDGWCTPVLGHEVKAVYEGLRAETRPALDEPRPYRDYIAWLLSQDPGPAERYWRKALAGFERPTLLRPGRAGNPSPNLQIVGMLSAELAESVSSFARANLLTLNTIFQGALALLISAYTGQRDVCYGVTSAGRPGDIAGVEQMIGMFLCTIPLRVSVDPDERVPDWLARLQLEQSQARRFEYVGLPKIQGWSKGDARQTLFDTLLIFQNIPNPELANIANVQVQQEDEIEQTNFPLTIIITPDPLLSIAIDYDPACFEEFEINRIVSRLTRLLAEVTQSACERLGDLSILNSA